MYSSAFGDNYGEFHKAYNRNLGYGTYTWNGSKWNYAPVTLMPHAGVTALNDLVEMYFARCANVVIRGGVGAICASAFTDDLELESVVIPDSVTAITQDAFKGCVNLNSIEIPANVSIRDEAFSKGLGGFSSTYNNLGRHAGRYVWSGIGWVQR
jgi:hypothetical protein